MVLNFPQLIQSTSWFPLDDRAPWLFAPPFDIEDQVVLQVLDFVELTFLDEVPSLIKPVVAGILANLHSQFLRGLRYIEDHVRVGVLDIAASVDDGIPVNEY